jgi:chromosome segregation ATPase
MGLKGLRDRSEEPSDLESEREALRRQRAEAAAELETLKRTLAERVTQVQERERELADALARVEKREQKLVAAEERSSRLVAMRLRLAEAKEARAAKHDEVDGPVPQTESVVPTQSPEAGAAAKSLADLARKFEQREAALAERERELEIRRSEVEARAAELAVRETALEESVVTTQGAEPEPASHPDELERIEARLAELREAEQAFARTQAELAARSDALALREEGLAARERALAAKESPAGADLEALETRIRRLEQGGRHREEEPQTFSAGLRALQERGLRTGRSPEEPLH